MNTLFILNGAPYGAEPTYNGLRLAGALARMEHQTVRLFLMGEVAACGTCLDARGIAAEEIGEGIHRGTLDELAQWTAWADKVLVF